MNNQKVSEIVGRLDYFFQQALKSIHIDNHNRNNNGYNNNTSVTIPLTEPHNVSYVDSARAMEFLRQLVIEVSNVVKDEIREQVANEYLEAESK